MPRNAEIPTVSFDVRLGKKFSCLAVDTNLVAEHLVMLGFPEENLGLVDIHLSANVYRYEDRSRLRYGEARKRRAT